MTVVTLDNSNLADMLTEAGYEAPDEKASATKPDGKTEVKAEVEADPKVEADDADDEEGEDGITARQKRELSGKMLKAIGKKHRQVKEAEEFAADQIRIRREAEARAAELEQKLKATQKATEQVKEAVEPVREDFATDGEYMKASIKWGVEEGIRQQRENDAAQHRLNQVQAQYRKAAELVPDFEAATSNMPSLPESVVAYMRESEMFAELGYHLAKNPLAAEKLSGLTPLKQLVELGRIESTLRPFGSSESSPKAGDKPDNGKADKAAPSTADTGFSPSKARSDAPVIKPLTSGEGTQVEVDPREMNTRQMIEDFQKNQRVNLHARKRH